MKYQQRITHLRKFCEHQEIDAFFVTTPSNLFYFSGFNYLSPTEREAYLLITKRHAYFITSKLYADEASEKTEYILQETSTNTNVTDILIAIAKQEQLKTIGFEENNVTFAEYEDMAGKIILFPTDITQLRMRKDSDEIEHITKACRVGDDVFTQIIPQLRPGISEKEVAFAMEMAMRHKQTIPSFPTIVAFGKNAAVPHHATGNDVLQNNQFVLLDFGVQVEKYCSDMSRTVFVGTPTEKEKRAYETVKIAQQEAINYITQHHTTATGFTADSIARNYIIEKGYADFPHTLGHGIGLDVHEPPRLSPYATHTLTPGMVFSVEPGIYITGELGIRIEDLMVMHDNAASLLTHSPRDLIIL